MKKLLILALVFGMTSAASAALSLGGATEVVEGDTAIVTVISDNTSNWMGYIEFDPGVVGVSAVVALPGAGTDSYVIKDPLGWTGYYEIQAADMSEPFDSVVPGVQFNIMVAGATAGDVYTIGLMANDWATYLDSVQVTVVVPEPMTIALLGLGGLFMLRRRK
jgi:hypothetical protein